MNSIEYNLNNINIGINLCWTEDDDLKSVLLRYYKWMQTLNKMKINFIRVWCPPWSAYTESIYHRQLSIEKWQQWQQKYFKLILDIAEENNIKVLICLYSHVEFIDKNWKEEVINRNLTWLGNPYNEINGGPCKKNWDFFIQESAILLHIKHIKACVNLFGKHPSLLGWELINEGDQIDGFSEKKLLNWIQRTAPILRKNKNIFITISFADGFKGSNFWNSTEIDIIQIHCHGWPYNNPISNILFYKEYWKNIDKPFFCGEFSWDSQNPPTIEQKKLLPNIIAFSKITGCILSSLPWWWEDILKDKSLLKKLKHLNIALSQMKLPIHKNNIKKCNYNYKKEIEIKSKKNSLKILKKWRNIFNISKLNRAIKIYYYRQISTKHNSFCPLYTIYDNNYISAYLNTDRINSKEIEIMLPSPMKKYIIIIYKINTYEFTKTSIFMPKSTYRYKIKQNDGIILFNIYLE